MVGRTLRVRRNRFKTEIAFECDCGAAGIRALPAYSMNNPYPERKKLDHRGPLTVCTTDAVYFITIAAVGRGTTELVDRADVILSAARFYQATRRWFLHLFLIMPDHIHMLVHVPPERTLADVIGHWKSYLTTQHGIRFQANFFDTRIRDQEHFAEKWDYICKNPMAKGLAATPREWPHSVAFDPATGQERQHR